MAVLWQVVDWLVGEVDAASSVKECSAVFRVDRPPGHARLAAGFAAWLASGLPVGSGDGHIDAASAYWLRHGVLHTCGAGKVAVAVDVYACDLRLLQRRADADCLEAVGKDYLKLVESCKDANVKLAPVTEMKSFVGKNREFILRDGGAAVAQLACQQPDDSVVFGAWRRGAVFSPPRWLNWRNKPQQADPCIATLTLKADRAGVAVSATHIVGAAGTSVFVYDAATQELREELEGESKVTCIATFEPSAQGGMCSLLVAGYKNEIGYNNFTCTIKMWDLGQPLLP